jgi:hypothetical protein
VKAALDEDGIRRPTGDQQAGTRRRVRSVGDVDGSLIGDVAQDEDANGAVGLVNVQRALRLQLRGVEKVVAVRQLNVISRPRNGAIVGGRGTLGSLYLISALVAAAVKDDTRDSGRLACLYAPAVGPFIEATRTSVTARFTMLVLDGAWAWSAASDSG